MAVVGVTDNAEMILEQIMMERLLDAVSPELTVGILQICMFSPEKALLWKVSMPLLIRVEDLIIKSNHILKGSYLHKSRDKNKEGNDQVLSPTLLGGIPGLLHVTNVASQAICLLIVVRAVPDRRKRTYCV